MSDGPPKHLTLPRRGPRLTLLAIGYGALVLFWLSPEDTAIWPVTALGAGGAIWVTLLTTLNRLGGQTFSRRAVTWGLVGLGGMAGALSGPLTATLMLIKTAMHSHLTPDYPLSVIGATLARTPAWGVAGALIGLGLALVWLAGRTSSPPS